MTRILAITGKVATGKTTIAQRLANELDWQYLSIDRERRNGGNWTTLVNKTRRLTQPAIIETVLLPHRYLRALAIHNTMMLHITCDERERQQRLGNREPRPATKGGKPRWLTMRTLDTTHGVPARAIIDITRWARLPRHP